MTERGGGKLTGAEVIRGESWGLRECLKKRSVKCKEHVRVIKGRCKRSGKGQSARKGHTAQVKSLVRVRMLAKVGVVKIQNC